MDVTVTSAPPPGTAAPGNLYIDTGSRQMWLGVDPAVDPSAALLICDIEQFETDIAQAESDANAYTDTQILTRAPTVHTHTSSQITDFTGAVQGVVNAMPSVAWVRGMIMMWSGSLAQIGVGGLAGWALCDGSNGTPDLRDRFVIGAGNKVPGSVNPASGATTQSGGQHAHNVLGTALSIANLPSHAHGGITGYVSNDHSHAININTGGQSTNHTHAGGLDGRNFVTYVGGSGGQGTSGGGFTNVANTNWNDRDHYHNVSGNTGGINANHYHAIPAEGSGTAHTHTTSSDGIHSHTITQNDLRDGLPYFAVAFIMKL